MPSIDHSKPFKRMHWKGSAHKPYTRRINQSKEYALVYWLVKRIDMRKEQGSFLSHRIWAVM